MKKPKSNILKKKHFDRAVKQPWSTVTCLIAQLALDNLDVIGSGRDKQIRLVKNSGNYIKPYGTRKARQLMETFDKNFHRPGDENHPALQALRASLPIEL